ncbi:MULTISPECIES: AAA family ATPase [unclassified Streptomyces]|uniref:helix-turn-helix transcriptional regulator n=1 Tax=unclassified Streptomyces TaxID=2593676 RepID=UPI0037BB655D
MDVEAVTGPDAERLSWHDTVKAVARALRSEGRVAVTGVWGSGRTTMLAEALDAAKEEGRTQVRVTCADGDQHYVFGGIAQLLSALPEPLPAPMRTGWATAVDRLLHRPPGGPAGLEEIAEARCAVAGLLRATPGVDIAVDDVQWLDEASADVLGYASRTIAATGLAVLVSERTPGRPGVAGRLLGGHPMHVPISALDLALTSAVVARHGLPHRSTSAVYRYCGGHRLLTEIACAGLAARPTPDGQDLPRAVVQTARDWLATLPAPVRATLLVAALARRPTASLLKRAGRSRADDHVRAAVAAGVLCDDRTGDVRFTALALADALVGVAGQQEQTEAHRSLACAEADPVHAVRHRALSRSEATDQCLAEDTAEAAGRARADGQRGLSAELFVLAAELTPVNRPSLRLSRFLTAAKEAAAAGDSRLARRAASAVAASRPTPAEHVAALLAVVDSHSQALAEAAGLLERCRRLASRDPQLLAAVELRAAIRANVSDSDPHEALRAARKAAELARTAGQPVLEAAALTMRARMERVLNKGDSRHTLDCALALNVAAEADGIGNSPQYLAARHAIFDDRLTEARSRLTVLLAVAEQQGQEEDLVDIWRSLAEVEVRSGVCARALTWAGKALDASVAAGLSLGPACYTAALAQSAGGSFAAALRYATYGERAAREEGDVLHRNRNLWMAGAVRLHTGDINGAVTAFARLNRTEDDHRPADPSVFRWQPDAIEAFIAAGELTVAQNLILASPAAARQDSATGAAWTRAQALLMARAGETDRAVELLRAAAEVFCRSGLPLEEARTHLAQGRIQRAHRRQAAARIAFQEARDLYVRARARPMLATVQEHLDRLNGQGRTRSQGDGRTELTDSEVRLADLVSRGATNQQAAQQMYISVKTVESMLSRVYRKLQIRSRTQLSAALTTSTG